ncbi:MAG: tetratricopeptide repeat protein [Verrucomicrobiae bacterium]|nr:tetratricopeptide repeat protein [Verrucomicrobiae bacterium]
MGVFLLAAFALIPDEGRIVRGLLQDEASYRLRELAAKRLNGDPDATMLPFLGGSLTAEQWQDQQQFGTVLAMVGESLQLSVVFASLQSAESIPPAQKAAIAVALILRAESAEDSDQSLTRSLNAFVKETMPKTPDAVMAAVQAYRRASKPKPAFELMRDLVAELGLAKLPANFNHTFRSIAFETGHVVEGYAVALHLWQQVLKENSPDALGSGRIDVELAEFIDAAQASGKVSEAAGALEARLGSNRILHQALTSASAVSREELESFEKFGWQLAEFSEWNKNPNRAFDVYARLAMRGDAKARARCCALQPGLYRGAELTAILLKNEVSLSAEQLHELADLVGKAGMIPETLRIYSRLIDAEPERAAELQTTLGVILDENGHRESALEVLRKAYAAAPRSKAGKALGRVLVTSGRYEEAMAHYAEMPVHDRDSASEFFHVASALGDDAAAVAALEARMAVTTAPIVPDYVELAETCTMAGKYAQAESALQRGLAAFPESRELTLRYIVMLGSVGRDKDALELLMERKEYATDPAAIARLVDLKITTSYYDRVLKWLGGEGVERRIQLSEEGKALVADIYLQTGRKASALALIAELPEKPKFAWMKAYVYFLNGQYRQAERLQSQYVAGMGRALPEAWRQLGRIRRVLGNEHGARECFAMALAILNKDSMAAQRAESPLSASTH